MAGVRGQDPVDVTSNGYTTCDFGNQVTTSNSGCITTLSKGQNISQITPNIFGYRAGVRDFK